MSQFKPPSVLCINLTHHCNLHCLCCRNWENPNRTPPGYHLALKNFLYRYSQYVTRPYFVVFAGAETLLYPELEDLLDFCKQLDLETQVVTNGILLTKEKLLRYKELYLKRITLPIEGVTAATHDSIRQYHRSHFDLIHERLNLIEKHFPELTVHINSVVCEKNYQEIPALVQWVNEQKLIKGIYLNMIVQPFGDDFNPNWFKTQDPDSLWPKNPEAVSDTVKTLMEMRASGSKIDNAPEQLEAFLRYLKDPLTFVHDACPIPGHGMIIRPDGKACYCPHFKHIFGDVLSQELEEMIHSPEFAEHQEFIRTCKINCHLSVNCFFKPWDE